MRFAFFDLDGTLIDRLSALDDAVSSLCRSRDLPQTPNSGCAPSLPTVRTPSTSPDCGKPSA
ncbi:hypothetical protein [Streptomyces collinus]|uniref:hypothetical protein n=1 Tax=Streptomyces collinus TaxID=42684 RepID=UPI0036A1E5B4